MTARNDHLSFSRLQRYERCPRSYQLHYIDKVAPEPVVALRFGKIVSHSMAAPDDFKRRLLRDAEQ